MASFSRMGSRLLVLPLPAGWLGQGQAINFSTNTLNSVKLISRFDMTNSEIKATTSGFIMKAV
jgi:hypothetical protein